MEDLMARFNKLSAGDASLATKLGKVAKTPSRTTADKENTPRKPSAVSTFMARTKVNKKSGVEGGKHPPSAPPAVGGAGEQDDFVEDPEAVSVAASDAGWTVTEDGCVMASGGLRLPAATFMGLFDHQRVGVRWMWGLFAKARASAGPGGGTVGGILGDDMGMGKTRQASVLLSGLLASGKARTALVVAPLSVLPTWEATLRRWLPKSTPLRVLHGGSAKKRKTTLNALRSAGGVCITTYGHCTTCEDLLADSRYQPWDALVLDEGHKLKNTSTKLYKSLTRLPVVFRLLLTGTPVQNNLDELFSLVSFISAGTLLGDRRSFNATIGNLISQAQDRRASEKQREAGAAAMTRLLTTIQPYLLRREKDDGGRSRPADAPPTPAPCATMTAQKKEVVVWTGLSPLQLTLYRGFLESDAVKAVLNTSKSPLAAIGVLKKLCCHPRLLTDRDRQAALAHLGAAPPLLPEARVTCSDVGGGGAPVYAPPPAPANSAVADVENSGKLQVLETLLAEFAAGGHRALVFSQSTKFLDVVQRVIAKAGHRYCRIDGSVSKSADRQAIVARYNTTPDLLVCLLTTGVGALGLTLTAADRVILLDPSWNPAVDAQAVDRAYRIGQTKDVVTYRFVTCGTVEEKMYRLQVFKGGLTQSVMAGKTQRKFFSRSDLRGLFSLGDLTEPETKALLLEHSTPDDSRLSAPIRRHLAVLDAGDPTNGLIGISHHDSLFSTAAAKDKEPSTPYGGRRKSSAFPRGHASPLADIVDDDSEREWSESEEEGSPLPPPESPPTPSSAATTWYDLNDSYLGGASPGVEQPPPCRAHVEATAAAGLTCCRCRCSLLPGQMRAYNDAVGNGLEAAHAEEYEAALEYLMDAVELCSDDPALHNAILFVAGVLELPCQQ